MRLNLTKNEYINLHKWSIGLKNHFVSKFDKVCMFHGSESGKPDLNKFMLWFYYQLGYKFICCYPKRVYKNLGFGQFIWPECDNIVQSIIDINDGIYAIEVNPKFEE